MKIIIHIFMVLVLQIPFVSHATGEGSVVAIAGGVAVDSVVNDIEQSTANLIEDLDNVVSARSFQLRLDLMFLLNEVESKGARLVGKTFDELNNSQQLFFANTKKSIGEIESLMSQGMDDVDIMLTHAEQLISQVPFTEEEPRIRSFSPLYIKSLEDSDSLKVSLKGSFLNHGEAKFEVAGKYCEKITQTDSSLAFLCSSESFVAFDEVNYVSGKLIVEEASGFWAGLFAKKPVYKEYVVNVSVVPKKLGAYEIQATVVTQQMETADSTGRWGHVNPHCRSSRSSTTNFGPRGAGWKIDVNSISTRFTNERRGSRRLQNVSENGFQVYAVASNSGNCVLGSRDARGASEGIASWQEYRLNSGTGIQTISSGDMEWGKDIVVDLPDNLRGFKVIVRKIDGNESIVNTAIDRNWFSVSRDGRSTSLIVSPKSLKEALSI